MSDNIEKLRDITKELNNRDFDVSFNALTTIRINSDSKKGSIIISRLYSQPFVDVSLVLMTTGAMLREHQHNVKQTIHVTEGALKITIDDNETQDMIPGDVKIIEKCENHKLEATEDTWMIMVNMPSDDTIAQRFK